MFGSTAQEVAKAKSSLPTLQDLPSNEKAPKAQVKATKKPDQWFTVGKFKAGTKKTEHQWNRYPQKAKETQAKTKGYRPIREAQPRT